MPSQYLFARRDYDNDRQQSSFDLQPGRTLTNISDLDGAFALLLGGSQGGTFFKQESQLDNGSPANSPYEQGSLQAIIEMTDDANGKPYIVRAPIPDLGIVPDVDGDVAWVVIGGLTQLNPNHATFGVVKTFMEENYMSPNGNSATLARIYVEE